MRRLPLFVASVALAAVCVVSRWCSQMQDDLDRLTGGRNRR